MTSDDQFFFDYLSSIPNDVKRYSFQVADSIDRHVEHAASVVRETLAQQSWIPPAIRPPSREPHGFSLPSSPQSVIDRVRDWSLRHRAWTAAILAFAGTGGLLIYGSSQLSGKKRKARRAINGARKEIIVIAGSPHEPMVKAIATDLERRGFIVYITVSSADEEHVVRSENRQDIRALWLDLTTTPSTPSDIHPSLHEIRNLITQPQSPMPGVPPHTCQLSGLILLPSPIYPTGPVATIPPSSWADTVNARLLSPILTTQIFLPLLTLRNTNSAILFLYPSISSSLSAPFSGPEVTTTRAISGFATSLRRELHLLRHNNIDVVEMRLGNIDLGSQFRNTHGHVAGTEVLTWNSQQRALYGSPYLASIDHRPVTSTGASTVRGSPARNLHYAVFDALAPRQKSIFGKKKPKTTVIYVGRGSRTYGFIGDWLPGNLVGWMFGMRTGPAAGWDSAGSGNSSETGWEKV
ncbi:hypothetical protein DTO271G3_1226 [Paecilomyces variotii]|nr:hypothetical protein DTO271G3_1226 [Paecilomyces variotii]